MKLDELYRETPVNKHHEIKTLGLDAVAGLVLIDSSGEREIYLLDAEGEMHLVMRIKGGVIS